MLAFLLAVLILFIHQFHYAVTGITIDGIECTSEPPDYSQDWCYIIPSGDTPEHPGWNTLP